MRFGIRHLGACAVCVTACNALVGFDELGPLDASDGGLDAAPSVDGSSDGGAREDAEARCDPLAPFGAPALAEGLNEGDGGTASGAVLTLDELEVFFVYTDSSSVNTLRHGRRTDRTQVWTAAQIVEEALDPVPTSDLSIAANGLRFYYRDTASSSNRVATRSASLEPFASPVPYTTPGAVFIAPSDETAYGSFRPDAGDTVLGRAANLGTTTELFEALPNVHVAGATDRYPVLNASETKLYFMSSRPTELARMGEVFMAERASKSSEFGPATRVVELSSGGIDDIVTWVSEDDCEVLLTRFTGIYRATRPK